MLYFLLFISILILIPSFYSGCVYDNRENDIKSMQTLEDFIVIRINKLSTTNLRNESISRFKNCNSFYDFIELLNELYYVEKNGGFKNENVLSIEPIRYYQTNEIIG